MGVWSIANTLFYVLRIERKRTRGAPRERNSSSGINPLSESLFVASGNVSIERSICTTQKTKTEGTWKIVELGRKFRNCRFSVDVDTHT